MTPNRMHVDRSCPTQRIEPSLVVLTTGAIGAVAFGLDEPPVPDSPVADSPSLLPFRLPCCPERAYRCFWLWQLFDARVQ